MAKREMSEHAKAAKAIRQYLKSIGVKASVRSESFAGGNAVDVDVNDLNPELYQQVKAECEKYQIGSFNSMEDIYEFDNRNNDLPQVKYVQLSNCFSDETKQAALDYLRANDGSCSNLPEDYFKIGYEVVMGQPAQVIVHRFLNGVAPFDEMSKNFWNQKEAA